jgi:hypothetical protein
MLHEDRDFFGIFFLIREQWEVMYSYR